MRAPFAFFFATAVLAQAPPTTIRTLPGGIQVESTVVNPDTQVATIDGKKYTAGELERFVAALPPAAQQNYKTNKKEFLRQIGMLRRLTEIAEKEGLGNRSPFKERLEWARMQVLWQAALDHQSQAIVVLPEDQKKFYDENQDRFGLAKIKALYIPFTTSATPQSDSKGRKVLTEAEAKAKAEELVKQIRGGADFVKLVKEHSGDVNSAAKDGDFGTVRKTDNLPEAVKTAVFALKTNEISDPVRQANGYYIFRLEERSVQPYTEVKDNIYNELKNIRMDEWMRKLRDGVEIKLDNEIYFGEPAKPGNSTAPPAAAPK
jgi:hypothetical protein